MSRVIKIQPLPSYASEAEIRKQLKDFKIDRVDLLGNTAFVTVSDFTSEQEELIEFLFPGLYHSEWNAGISLDDSVADEYQRARQAADVGDIRPPSVQDEKPKVTFVEKPYLERPH